MCCEALVEEDAAGPQLPARVGEEAGQELLADLLEHADARHLVEALGLVELAIVADLRTRTPGEPGRGDALVRQLGLRPAERDAHGLDAVPLGGVDEQPAPAAPDVEQPLAGTQPQLAADEVELPLLRRVEVLVGRGEVGAGVDHAPVEVEREEVVREVVVVRDGLAVAFERELPPAEARRSATGPGRAPAWEREQAGGRAEPLARAPAAFEQELVGEPEDALDVALDVDVVVEVRLGHVQLVRRPEQRPQGARMLEDEREARRPAVLCLPASSRPRAGRRSRAARTRRAGRGGRRVSARRRDRERRPPRRAR